ncbi:(2Fe-2S)-binding protein [Qipengyuania qiaonensis]|uniref:(2Fe-2S)-binding protein n=1 Tax=Qipengyuania qiaonensis TaxID=2867240 RepID=A0ABS7JBE1_9SPHN|nr:(2Fe-2S)-binding protein [Qipengyuania qiaonensis]
MYVCICNAIRESDLRRAAHDVSGDAEACYAALGKMPSCGSCLDEAECILQEERELGFVPAAA